LALVTHDNTIGDEKNMALEAFLLHFRNLRAFLCPSMQNVRVTNILASDFLDEPTPRDVGNTAKFVNSKERLDQMLAHLTYDRSDHIAAGEHGWRTDDMLSTLAEQPNRFFAVLPKDRAAWFPVTVRPR